MQKRKAITSVFIVLFALVFGMAIAFAAGVFHRGARASAEDFTPPAQTEHSAEDHAGWTALTNEEIASCVGALKAGSYYLAEDITLEDVNLQINRGAEVQLCLNGHMLQSTVEGAVITVQAGATLRLFDCNAETSHAYYVAKKDAVLRQVPVYGASGEEDTYYGSASFYNYQFGTPAGDSVKAIATLESELNNSTDPAFTDESEYYTGTIAGGVITGGTAGAVKLSENAALVMMGGTIAGNTSASSGSAVAVAAGASFTMYGGSIEGNTVNSAAEGADETPFGGAVAAANGNVYLAGGAIANNQTVGGGNTVGGVLVQGGTFTIAGGTVSNNRAGSAGGVMAYDAAFALTSGLVSENIANGHEFAEAQSGGATIVDPVSVAFTGGTVAYNFANGAVGGVMFASVENTAAANAVTLENVTFTGNAAKSEAGGYAAGAFMAVGAAQNVTANIASGEFRGNFVTDSANVDENGTLSAAITPVYGVQSGTTQSFAGAAALLGGGTLNVTGGSFSGGFITALGGTLNVTGGNFTAEAKEATASNNNYTLFGVPFGNGYGLVTASPATGDYTLTVSQLTTTALAVMVELKNETDSVVVIDGAIYLDMDAAITAIRDGMYNQDSDQFVATVTLLQDVTLSDRFEIAANLNLTLNMFSAAGQPYTLTADVGAYNAFMVNGTLTVNATNVPATAKSAIVPGASVTAADWTAIQTSTTGTTVLNSVAVTGGLGIGYADPDGGSLTLQNASVTGNIAVASGTTAVLTDSAVIGDVTVVSGATAEGWSGYAIYGTLTVNQAFDVAAGETSTYIESLVANAAVTYSAAAVPDGFIVVGRLSATGSGSVTMD